MLPQGNENGRVYYAHPQTIANVSLFPMGGFEALLIPASPVKNRLPGPSNSTCAAAKMPPVGLYPRKGQHAPAKPVNFRVLRGYMAAAFTL
jgi:hypothetical protein